MLWPLPAPLSRNWSFSHQIRLVSNSFRQKGVKTIFIPADSTLGQIKSILKRKPVSFIMMHGYPDMFPFLSEEGTISAPIFFWAQVSGLALAGRYKDIKINNFYLVPLTPRSKYFFDKAGCPRVTEAIPHMVDIKAFHPLSPAARKRVKVSFGLGDKFVYGKIAVNCRRKRLDDLIRIYAELKDKIKAGVLVLKTKKISLEGDDLGKLAKDLGLEGKVIFIEDHLASSRLNQLYNALDLYCHISEWEGFGLTIAEAMAAKVPVLAHATQGPGEYLPYKEFLVPSRELEKAGETAVALVDEEEFKKKLLRAYEDRGSLTDFAERGYRYARENFSPEIVADKFLQLSKKTIRMC